MKHIHHYVFSSSETLKTDQKHITAPDCLEKVYCYQIYWGKGIMFALFFLLSLYRDRLGLVELRDYIPGTLQLMLASTFSHFFVQTSPFITVSI